jgi:hypothetical protein
MGKVEFKEFHTDDGLIEKFRSLNVSRVLVKRTAANDNSKNQVYLGGSFDVLQTLPFDEITSDPSRSERPEPKFKATLSASWLSADGRILDAPRAQLILYPKYPEVRFSGFLKGCAFNLTNILGVEARIPDRVLIFGCTNSGTIYLHVLSPNNPLAQLWIEKYALSELKKTETFQLSRSSTSLSSRDLLLQKIRLIHSKGFIESCRLNPEGERIQYKAQNGGGYTLEAEFGITPNGYSEPDFEGWELKQYTVNSFERPGNQRITLMTPEPTGGIYKSSGPYLFLQNYGYPDQKIDHRLNFSSPHYYDKRNDKTTLTLGSVGYDTMTGKITDSDGAIVLIDPKDNIAASWDFAGLLKHWNKKHHQAAYIPSIKMVENGINSYKFGATIDLAERTNFTLFLKAFASSAIYYDPAVKAENIDSGNPKIKRRNQFRIQTQNLSLLYENYSRITV